MSSAGQTRATITAANAEVGVLRDGHAVGAVQCGDPSVVVADAAAAFQLA